jgi:hypothetical protein
MDDVTEYFARNPDAHPTLGELVAALQTPRQTLKHAILAGHWPDLVYVWGPSHGRRGQPAKVVCTRATAERIASGKAAR